jgi:lysophospholipase L1-like esterase
MQHQEPNERGIMGWTQCLPRFLDDGNVSVTLGDDCRAVYKTKDWEIRNEARAARSTKTFLSERRFVPVEQNLAREDILLLSFGHNDCLETKTERYTTTDEYTGNLRMMANLAEEREALVYLITPPAPFATEGDGFKVRERISRYADVMAILSGEMDVPLIDLYHLGRNLGFHSGWHIADKVHLSEDGAKFYASVVASFLKG